MNNLTSDWDSPHFWCHPTFACPFQKRVQGVGDSPKWTYDPHQLKWNAKEQSCLLYSIGSEGNFQWEDGMLLKADGLCEIHDFDYSRNFTRRRDHERNIHFHQWGLQSSPEPKREPAWLTMPEIIKELRNEDRTINISKSTVRDLNVTACKTGSVGHPSDPSWNALIASEHIISVGILWVFCEEQLRNVQQGESPWSGETCLELSYIKLHSDFLGRTSKRVYRQNRFLPACTLVWRRSCITSLP